MDIDAIDRKVRELMAFKERAEPMVAAWEAFRAKEMIGAEPAAPTAAEHDARAKAILGHAVNISRIVSAPPPRK